MLEFHGKSSGLKPQYSVIIPVFNRPAEVKELLESLVNQSFNDFEVIILEDGSGIKCEEVVKSFQDLLNVSYFFKENSGPGDSRNYGAFRASSDYFIFFDSDCIIPVGYFEKVNRFLKERFVDSFGGPDDMHPDFTPIQKAISYSMTSIFTTGGIRGRSKSLESFHPRSFNMGFSRKVFQQTHGFAKMRFGEDMDLSIRIKKAGFSTALIKEAFVFHKRRTDFRKFYKQVYNSGIARINLFRRYPGSLKLVHAFPSAFVIYFVVSVIAFLTTRQALIFVPLAVFSSLIFVHSTYQNKSFLVGFLSIIASFVQLGGYGLGFLNGVWRRIILRKDEFHAFQKSFYK